MECWSALGLAPFACTWRTTNFIIFLTDVNFEEGKLYKRRYATLHDILLMQQL
ncbi:hypothetical protein M422DRAFT_36059 [Sphaerobolus stellatus SS14]|uniref:Unplaced genomic scaffold SPHSTscaffold_158, whole genome shotgun sequence n=1 Tax=Sphaerobolus stellatus (strain SS14) TaxID=990650 RepID=A0A0C9V3L1_SPHS4|nr:hypothetical protein M422DRAFT_36059 [Sphaerobolus stellatus SS14]